MRTPPSLKVVLLLVNAEPGYTAKALEVVKPDIVQFHGTETPEWLRVVEKRRRSDRNLESFGRQGRGDAAKKRPICRCG